MARTVSVGTIQAVLRLVDKDYASGLRNAGRTTASFQQQAVGAAKLVTKAFAAGGVAATVFAAASVKLATDLNRSMANVATLIPGATDRVRELRSEVQELAIAHGKDTQDLAAGLYQTISAFGDDAANTVEILRINSEAAAAGLASTEESINLTASVTKAWGDTNAEAVQKAADLALMTVRLGQTDFPQLAGSMGRVIPLAQSMGQTQEEMFAVFATATGVVGNAARVSTQYQGVLASLMKPTESLTALIKEQGLTSGEALLQQEGFVGTLQLIRKAAEDNKQPLTDYIQQIEAVPLALALSGPQADTFAKKLAELEGAAGASAAAFREQSEGVNKAGFMFNQLKQQGVVLMQMIGESLMPVVTRAMEMFQEWLTGRGGVKGLAMAFGDTLPRMIEFSVKALIQLSRAWTGIRVAAVEGSNLLVLSFKAATGAVLVLLEKTLKLKAAYDLVTGNLQGYTEATLAASNMQTAANAVFDDAITNLEEFGVEADAATLAQAEFERSLTTVGDSLVAVAEAQALAARTAEAYSGELQVLNVTAQSTASILPGMGVDLANVESATWGSNEALTKYTQTMSVEFHKSMAITEEQQREVAAAQAAVNKRTREGQDALFGYADGLRGIHPAVDGVIDKMKSFLGIFTKVFDFFKGGGKDLGIGNFFDTIAGAFGKGGKDTAAAWGSSFAPAYESIMGNIATEASGGFMSTIGGILGAAAGWLPIVGPLLAAFGGPLIKGIKALGSKIGSLFKSIFKSAASFREERAGSIFGVFQVPESVLSSIGALSVQFSKAKRELPDTIASIVGFDDVIRAVGIETMPQFMLAMNKGDEAVLRLGQGIITTGEAAEFFGTDSLRIMQDAAVALGGTAVAEFDHMIRKAVEAGITIPEEFLAATDAIVDTTVAAAAAVAATATTAVDVTAAAAVSTTRVADRAVTEVTRDATRSVRDMSKDIEKIIEGMDLEIPMDLLLNDKSGNSSSSIPREGYAGGSDGFRNFGMGTSVRLHGIERVQTPAQAAASDGGNMTHELMALIHAIPDMITNAMRYDSRTKRRV